MTPVSLEVLTFAVEMVEAEQRFPTVREIADRFGWSSSAAPSKHLRRLTLLGFVERRSGGYRVCRLPSGAAVACRLVPEGRSPAAVRLRGAPTSPVAHAPSPTQPQAGWPVKTPEDFRERFIRMARAGRGSPAQQLAGQLLDAHGDAAWAHLPVGAPPGTAHFLKGCGCTAPQTSEVSDA